MRQSRINFQRIHYLSQVALTSVQLCYLKFLFETTWIARDRECVCKLRTKINCVHVRSNVSFLFVSSYEQRNNSWVYLQISWLFGISRSPRSRLNTNLHECNSWHFYSIKGAIEFHDWNLSRVDLYDWIKVEGRSWR